MKGLFIEHIGDVHIYFAMGVKIIFALLLGGLIGLDREKKMKSAGIKTNILICIGATVYTSISMLVLDRSPGLPVDPNRVAAQIVSGIGFLGAGAIIQGRGNVIGMTTAATIWAVAAIGMTIGFGYPIIATLITVTILVVLKLIDPIYKLLESKKYFEEYHIEVLSHGKVRGAVKEIIFARVDDIHDMVEELVDQENDVRLLHVYLALHPRWTNSIRKDLKQLIKVDKVKIHKSGTKL
jgi:putative Mg2+ transporter-C (MgtC) family protein